MYMGEVIGNALFDPGAYALFTYKINCKMLREIIHLYISILYVFMIKFH
jgi:hypothetical protein